MASSIEYDLTLGQETVSTGVNKIVGSIAVLDSTMGKTGADIVKALDAGVAATNRLEAALSQTESRAKASGSGIGASLQKAFEFATGGLLAQGISKIGSSVLDLGKDTLDAAGTVEQAKIAYTGLLGSATAANDELAKIRALANSTPFEFTQLTKAEQMMLAVGMSTDKARQSLIDAGNAVAAFGGSADQLNSVALAIEQVHSKGKLQGQEALQLVNAGIPVWQMMAAALHKTTAEVQDLSSQGKITADVFEQAFHTYSVERFGGAMEAQSHTWKGLLSTASDLKDTFAAAFGTPLIDALEPKLEKLLGDLSDPTVTATLTKWGEAAAKIVTGFIDAAENVGKFAVALSTDLKPLWDALGGGQVDTSGLTTNLQGAADAAAQIKTNFAPVPDQTKTAKDEAEGYREVISRIREQAQDVAYADDLKIDKLREQATLLDRQYESSRKEADLHKAGLQLAGDRALAVNKFSRSGQEAARRVADDESRVQDLQGGIAHDSQKQAIDDRIHAIEAEKKAKQHQFDLEERGYNHLIDNLKKSQTETLTVGTAGQHSGGIFDKAFKQVHDTVVGVADQVKAVNAGLRDTNTVLSSGVLGVVSKAVDNVKALTTSWNALAKGWNDPAVTNQQRAGALAAGLEVAPGQILGATLGAAAGVAGAAAKTFERTGLEDPNMDVTNWVLDAAGLPRDAKDQRFPHQRTGLGPNDYVPANAPPNRDSKHGHYINVNGMFIWHDDAPGGQAPGPDVGALPGRALGGPVGAGQAYTVGENGPETLVMGNQGGNIIPNGAYLGSGGGGGGGDMKITVEHLCPACLRSEMQDVISNSGQLIGQSLGGYRRGRRR